MTKLRDERGTVLLLVAVSLTLFLLCAAFAVDIGNARQVARNYQAAADGAALAGAQGLPDSADSLMQPPPMAWDFAADYAFQTLAGIGRPNDDCAGAPTNERPSGPGITHCYLHSSGDLRVYVTTPWNDVPEDPTPLPGGHQDRQINVKVCGNVSTGFARVVGISFIRPCRLATAMSALGTGPCAVCILGDFDITGNGNATISGSGAWINSNATHNGNGTFLAPDGFYVGVNATNFDPPNTPAVEGAQTTSDPLASLPTPWAPDWVPPVLPCTGVPCGGKFTFDDSPGAAQHQFVSPGIYTSINVIGGSSNQTLTLRPGFYVIRDKFEITSDVSVIGTGVTIYFACKGGYEPPNFQLCGGGDEGAYFLHSGGGNVTFSASTTFGDPYQNLLFFFDRNNNAEQRFIGGSANVKGTIYAKSGRVVLGGGTFNSLFVVGSMSLAGLGSLAIQYVPSEQVPTYLPALIT